LGTKVATWSIRLSARAIEIDDDEHQENDEKDEHVGRKGGAMPGNTGCVAHQAGGQGKRAEQQEKDHFRHVPVESGIA
jgi:hypothetical protein